MIQELNIYQSRIDDLSRAEIQKQMLEKKVQVGVLLKSAFCVSIYCC